jgi:spore germination protein YaaH
MAQYDGTETRTTDGHEVRMEYVDARGYAHLAYYCDATTTEAKEAFLARYPVAGYCYWHLGCADPAYYN